MVAPTKPRAVVVVGSTVAGLVAAADLARAGVEVTIVAAGITDPRGSGAASVGLGTGGHTVALHHGEDTAVAYLRGLGEAVREIRATAQAAGVACTRLPGWGVAVDGHLAFQLRHEARLLRLAGIAVDFFDDQPFALDVRPMSAVAGQCRVDPDAYHDTLVRAARDAGVAFSRDAVTRVLPDGVATTWDRLAADAVIDTVGVLGNDCAPALRGMRLRTLPVVDLEPLSWRAGEPRTGPIEALAAWIDTPLEQMISTGQGCRIVGRDGGSVDELARWAEDHLGARVRRVSRRTTEDTADGLPVVGPVPGRGAAWVARGFGSNGLAAGTWGGHEVAAAVLAGRPTQAPPLRLAGHLAASFRSRFGVLAHPKQSVADVLRSRGLSRRVSERG